MIQILTSKDCLQCDKLKSELRSLGVEYTERKLDEDVSREWIKENLPGKTLLPIVLTDAGVYSGPIEVGHVLSEYRENIGKQLLNENHSGEFSYD